MKALIILLGFTLLVGCNSEEPVKRNDTPDQDVLEVGSVNPANPFTNLGSGPTGSTDPVAPPPTPPATGPFPTPPAPPVAPTAVQFCGTVYKNFVTGKDLFLETGSMTPSFITGVYPASSVLVQNIYPNDSKDVCLMGYVDATVPVSNGMNTIKAESIDVIDSNSNPDRPNLDLFTHEICGVVTQQTDFNGFSYTQIVENNLVAYILNNESMLAIPATTSSSDPAFVLKGCVYSNSAPYNDFSTTFKKFIDIEAVDFD